MTFLDLALGYAARGWYVLPLKPRDKFPIIPKSEGGNGYKDATLDEQLIRQWWARWPDANIGIACGASNLFVSDCDHGLNNFGDFESWCIRNGLPITYTVHSGGRDGFRVQMYYSGAIPCGKKFELDGVCGEIRSGGFLVVAAGSIHPISGEKYEVLVDAPIALRPEIFEKSIVTLKTELADRKPGELITENRNMHAVSELGKLRARMHPTQEQALAFLLQWNSDTCAEPLPEEEIAELVHKNFRMYPDTPEPPGVTVGRTSIVATDKGAVEEVVEELDKSLAEPPAPEYPLSVWEGTLYLDFARRAQRGNFMPLEFLVEGAMTYTGAVLGERLRGPSEDITPRMYTVLIAGPGIGKGSSFKRIKRLYYSHRLFHNRKEDVIPPYASALVNASGSENGLNDALLKHSRVIQEFEEVDRLLEKTEIQGSGGSLMSVIRTCFDSTEPGITTCKGRPLVAELAYLSLMGATRNCGVSAWRAGTVTGAG